MCLRKRQEVQEVLRSMMYYLGIPVEIVPDRNVKGKRAIEFGLGYVNARWPDGKVYTHWRAQLYPTRWPSLLLAQAALAGDSIV
jgi:hypothetical protein